MKIFERQKQMVRTDGIFLHNIRSEWHFPDENARDGPNLPHNTKETQEPKSMRAEEERGVCQK